MKALLVLLALAVVALAFPVTPPSGVRRVLLTVPVNSASRMPKLASGQIRLVLDDLALVVATEEEAALLAEQLPQVVSIGSFASAEEEQQRLVVVLEKQALVTDTLRTLKEWRAGVEDNVRSRVNMRLLRVLPTRVIIEVHGDISALRDMPISGDTEVVPMLRSPIVPLSSANAERLRKLRMTFKNKERRADIPALLNQVNQTVLRDFVEYLSGEQSGSPILTRNSYSVGSGVTLAANYIRDEYNRYGFSAVQETFRTDMGPNVIATLRGSVDPNTYVVIGAHYDSRGSSSTSTTQRAPGANDDGSGTGALLQVAKIIADNGLRFRYSVILGSWGGEEQGLIGSRAYAAKCRSSNLDIFAMLQADMIAYRVSSEAYQAAYPNRNDDPDLTALSIEVVNTYVPQLQTCFTSACCSDHQSFVEQGYSATQLFERCGPIADNRYHDSGDLVNRAGYDLLQLQYNTRALLANLLVFAEAL